MIVSYDVLPEAREWSVGQTYRAKMVLRGISQDENGVEFQVLDASSLEPKDRANQIFMSEGGIYLRR